MKLQFAVALLAASLCLAACGPGDENNETNNDSNNTTNASNDTGGEPAQATVEDGAGGESECPNGAASPDDVPDYADILSVDVDYDGSEAVVTITFAGDAQSTVAANDGTSYDGFVQAGNGTNYPFAANSGEWQNGIVSLATEFSAEWTSNSVAVLTIGGFEAGDGGIVRAEVSTNAPATGDPWCDTTSVEL